MRSALPTIAAAVFLTATLCGAPLHAQAPDPILPDRQLTPGAAVVDRDAMCMPGYSRGVRYVPADVHLQVFWECGLVPAMRGIP